MKTKRTLLIAIAFIMMMSIFSVPAESFGASKPAKVTIHSCEAAGEDAISVAWNKVKGAAGYELNVAGGQTYKVGADTLSKEVTGLIDSTNYTFKVRAYKTYKQKKWYNKKTKKYQAKKPKKKYCGKAKNFNVRVYGNYSEAHSAMTDTLVDKYTLLQMFIDQMVSENTKADYSTGGFTWDTERKTKSWTYYNGLMMQAFIETGEAAFADDFYDDNIHADGTIKGYNVRELDSVASARGLFDLLGSENGDKYKKAIQYTFTKLEEQDLVPECGGNVYHKQTANGGVPSNWTTYPVALDGLYMSLPFLVLCANAIEAGEITLYHEDGMEVFAEELYGTVYSRLIWMDDNLRTSDLVMHGYNPASGQTNGICWLRGAGWYCMCLVDVAEMMPEGELKEDLICRAQNTLAGMMAYQDESGLWYNVPEMGAELPGNMLEVSGSAMLAYSMLKAHNNGFITDSCFKESAADTIEGIVDIASVNNGTCTIGNIYKSSSVVANPMDYCNGQYVVNEAKGLGPVILALAEAYDAGI